MKIKELINEVGIENDIFQEALSTWNNAKNEESQKDFAMKVKDYPYA